MFYHSNRKVFFKLIFKITLNKWFWISWHHFHTQCHWTSFCCCRCLFFDTVSVHSHGFSWTHYVNQDFLKLTRDMPASACKVLGLRVYTTSPCLNICFICLPISLLSFIAHPALFLTSSFVPFPGSLSTPNSPRPLHVICIPMHFLFFSSPLKSLYTIFYFHCQCHREREKEVGGRHRKENLFWIWFILLSDDLHLCLAWSVFPFDKESIVCISHFLHPFIS